MINSITPYTFEGIPKYWWSNDPCIKPCWTWFSCSLYSFHSEQAKQKSNALEHLCRRTPVYSFFRGGVDRTVTWPVLKQDGGALSTVYWATSMDLPIGSDNYSCWKNMVISKMDWKQMHFVILFSSCLQSVCVIFFTILTVIVCFTPEYSKVPSFACFWWLFWRTPCTLKFFQSFTNSPFWKPRPIFVY